MVCLGNFLSSFLYAQRKGGPGGGGCVARNVGEEEKDL
jgi:hypothetical protein